MSRSLEPEVARCAVARGGDASPRAAPFAAAWTAIANAAEVGQGTSLLDLGCGAGEFCAFAARRGAVVHGLDVEPEAVGEALARLPGADLRLGLMERLPWPDASFDVVTSFNALQYALDPELALTEACRVLSPGGVIAICKWGPPDRNAFFAFLLALGANGVQGNEIPATDPMRDAMRSVGVTVVRQADCPAPIEMAGDEALRVALARAGIEADSAPGPVDVAAAAAPYRRADGSYRFDNVMRYWIVCPPAHR